MTHTAPPPSCPDSGTAELLRGFLVRCGYSEPDLSRSFGVQRWHDLWSLGVWEIEERSESLPPPLQVLLRLFRSGLDVDEETAVDALGADVVDALRATGLIGPSEEGFEPLAMLTPVDDLFIAADAARRHLSRAADFVLGSGGATRRLSSFFPDGPQGSVLDLGAGAGTLGAGLARRADRVVATDLNPRAVAFARFNVALNGLENMECREGSLFEPVEGERFDLIVCNPPYVLSPEATFTYRDGEPGICRTLVGQAARHLAPGGRLLMLTEWGERREEDWSAEVASWVADAGCDAWLLRLYGEAPGAYANRWLSQEHDRNVPREAWTAWVENLRSRGFTAVGGGLLVLRPTRGGVPGSA